MPLAIEANHPPAEPSGDGDRTQPDASVRAAYRSHIAGILCQRLEISIGCFVVLVILAASVELAHQPGRRRLVMALVAFEALVCLLALVLARLPRLRDASRGIAATLAGVLAVAITVYMHATAAPVERVAIMHVCLLTAEVVLLPWGALIQLALAIVSVAAFLWGLPAFAHPEGASYAVLALGTSALTSVLGASYLDRYRYDAFVHTALLDQAAAYQRGQNRLLQMIGQVQSQFIADGDAAVVFGTILQMLLRLTESDYGFVGEVLRRPSGEPYLKTHALTNIAWDDATRRLWAAQAPSLEFTNLATLFGAAILTGEPVIANDPGHDPRRGGLPPGHPPLEAFLALPVYQGTELVGLAGVANRPGGYDRVLARMLEPFCITVGSIIAAYRSGLRREQAETAFRDEAALTAALADAGRTLISSLETSVLLERLCRLTVDTVGCDGGVSLLWRPRDDVYATIATEGEIECVPATTVPREMLSLLFARSGDECVIEVDVDSPEGRRVLQVDQTRPLRALVLALRVGTEVIGLQIASLRAADAAFTVRQRRIAEGLARMASMALTNARLLEDVQRANRFKSDFVSTMSHELRTPLNVMLGYTEMAQDPATPAAEQRDCLARIEIAGRDLLELIEGTLEIGRIEAGRDEVRLERVALRPLWTELGTICGRLPRRDGVGLVWGDGCPDVDWVLDARKLQVVVRNLVGNALKFTDVGAVQAVLTVEVGGLVVTVRDTGVGISRDDQGAIFDMFRQADGSDSRHGGVGLGLYIVRRFVEQLGGTIAVQSRVGVGSTFVVTLPARTPRPDAPAPRPSP